MLSQTLSKDLLDFLGDATAQNGFPLEVDQVMEKTVSKIEEKLGIKDEKGYIKDEVLNVACVTDDCAFRRGFFTHADLLNGRLIMDIDQKEEEKESGECLGIDGDFDYLNSIYEIWIRSKKQDSTTEETNLCIDAISRRLEKTSEDDFFIIEENVNHAAVTAEAEGFKAGFRVCWLLMNGEKIKEGLNNEAPED